MKNVILGLLGCVIAIYTIVSCLSIYSISSRKNEVENCVAQVVKQNMQRYYAKEHSDAEVSAFVKQDLISQLRSDSRVSVDILACDMRTGILSVSVKEGFLHATGTQKVIQCNKAMIVEEEEDEEEISV